MISFTPLELSDKERVQQYTFCTERRNCDLSFANLYSWRFLYHTQIAEEAGFLLFRFYVEGELTYMMPVGGGQLADIVPDLMDDARQQGHPFCMAGLSAECCNRLEANFPGRFVYESDRDYADYIYLRTDLSALRGKKYQPKRNHLNKFRTSYPDYVFRPLTPELVSECLRLENEWCKANNCSENQALMAERRSMENALEHMEELGLLGGVLYAQGRMVAFTYGMAINSDTFDVCVEKADATVDGAYTMINREFSAGLPEQFTYINREEDLGLDGLRKAKLSYHPSILLDKFTARAR